MERLETMKTLLCQLIRDTNEKIQDGEKYFNNDIERAIIESKKGIDHIYYEYLSNYYKVKSTLASLKYKFHNMQDIVNTSSMIHDVTNILSEISVINTRANVLIAKNEICTPVTGVSKTNTIKDLIRQTLNIDLLHSEINPFIIKDKPTKKPFINEKDLRKLLEECLRVDVFEDDVIERLTVTLEYISGSLFHKVTRDIVFMDGNSSKQYIRYSIVVSKESASYEIFQKNKDEMFGLVQVLSLIGWEGFERNFKSNGDIEFTFTTGLD